MPVKFAKCFLARDSARTRVWVRLRASRRFSARELTDGGFEIDFNVAPSRETITRSTTGLLMEGMQYLDEAARDAADSAVEDGGEPVAH